MRIQRLAMSAMAALAVGVSASLVPGASAAAATPQLTGPIAVGQNVDGRLELFATATNTTMYHRRQIAPGGAWTAWESFGQGARWPTVAANADGRLELVAISAGRMMHRWQNAANGGWSDWYTQDSAGVTIQSPPALIVDGTRRLRVFAVDTSGEMVMKSESSASAGPWTPWTRLSSGIFAGYPAAGRNLDGRLEIVARISAERLWHSTESAPGSGWMSSSGWSAWDTLGGNMPFDAAVPAIAPNADGRLELFAIGRDGHAYGQWQTAVNGPWSGWYDHGAGMLGTVSPVLGLDRDLRLEVFTMDTDFAIRSKHESAPSAGPWIGWDNLGGRFGTGGGGDWSGPVVIRGYDGYLQLFALGNGQVNTRRQVAPNGSWTAWTAL